MLEPKDSLWIDTTDHTPYPMRKNGFTLINKVINKSIIDKNEEKFEEN